MRSALPVNGDMALDCCTFVRGRHLVTDCVAIVVALRGDDQPLAARGVRCLLPTRLA